MQRNGFLCAALGTKISIALTRKLEAVFLAEKDSYCSGCREMDLALFMQVGRHEKQLENEQRYEWIPVA